jgi:hypothetical protein
MMIDLDFELSPGPYYYLKLKYPIHSVHPTEYLSIDPTKKQGHYLLIFRQEN